MRGSRAEVGTETVSQNGYRYRKVDDSTWRLVHHLLAEEKYGRPIKEYERVVFVDGDRTNLDPSNIEIRRKTVAQLRKRAERLEEQIKNLVEQRNAILRQIEHLTREED
jgi:DNA-binding transcriptional MerR regulator